MRKLLSYWLEALLALCILLCLAQTARCEKKITDYSCTAQLHTEPDGKTVRYWVVVKICYSDGTHVEKKEAMYDADPLDGKRAVRNARHKAQKACSDWMDKTEDSLADEK